MILIPIRTDRRLQHVPWVNTSLILANVVIFIFVNYWPALRERSRDFWLDPAAPRIDQFITYQFLHEGWMHLLGNMIFLYVFGNSVEDRLGKIGYLAFYLAGGILAGLGQCILTSDAAPVLGASGSIAAVTGAYLAMFPASNVTIGYFFFIFGAFEISSLFLILFQIGENLFMLMTSNDQVAYLAHLSGYVYGFMVGMGLLWSRLLAREPYDLLSMLEHRRRRVRFASMTRRGYQPWEGAGTARPGISDDRSAPQPPSPEDRAAIDLRLRISQALAEHQTSRAAALYKELLELSESQVLPAQAQIDVANQFASQGDYEMAARAYELYLGAFRSDGNRDQVELILALIYTRYLHRFQRARELLNACLPRLQDPQLKDLARQALTQINA